MATDVRAIVRQCIEDVVCRGDMVVADRIIARDIEFTTGTGAVIRGRSDCAPPTGRLRPC